MPGVESLAAPRVRCGRFTLDLSRAIVMGVVNVTPDSFSDGGQFADSAAAITYAHRLVEQGAGIIDIGGESTRPNADPVPAAVELERVLPVLRALRSAGVPLSIDTSKPEVMRAALAQGADMINDVYAFRAPGALEVMAPSGAGLCIMHMQGEPRTMQRAPHYANVVTEVGEFLAERARAAEAAGVSRARILIDPGFGFGKTLEHNLQLLRELQTIAGLGWPVLVGLSRKSMLGRITGRQTGERSHASVAAALLAVLRGARIVRSHDVQATGDALAVLHAVQEPAESEASEKR